MKPDIPADIEYMEYELFHYLNHSTITEYQKELYNLKEFPEDM